VALGGLGPLSDVEPQPGAPVPRATISEVDEPHPADRDLTLNQPEENDNASSRSGAAARLARESEKQRDVVQPLRAPSSPPTNPPVVESVQNTDENMVAEQIEPTGPEAAAESAKENSGPAISEEDNVAVVILASPTTPDSPVPESLTDGSGEHGDKRVSFAPGTPEPKPTTRKKKKSARSKAKKRVAVPGGSLPEDIVAVIDESLGSPQLMPIVPFPNPEPIEVLLAMTLDEHPNVEHASAQDEINVQSDMPPIANVEAEVPPDTDLCGPSAALSDEMPSEKVKSKKILGSASNEKAKPKKGSSKKLPDSLAGLGIDVPLPAPMPPSPDVEGIDLSPPPPPPPPPLTLDADETLTRPPIPGTLPEFLMPLDSPMVNDGAAEDTQAGSAEQARTGGNLYARVESADDSAWNSGEGEGRPEEVSEVADSGHQHAEGPLNAGPDPSSGIELEERAQEDSEEATSPFHESTKGLALVITEESDHAVVDAEGLSSSEPESPAESILSPVDGANPGDEDNPNDETQSAGPEVSSDVAKVEESKRSGDAKGLTRDKDTDKGEIDQDDDRSVSAEPLPNGHAVRRPPVDDDTQGSDPDRVDEGTAPIDGAQESEPDHLGESLVKEAQETLRSVVEVTDEKVEEAVELPSGTSDAEVIATDLVAEGEPAAKAVEDDLAEDGGNFSHSGASEPKEEGLDESVTEAEATPLGSAEDKPEARALANAVPEKAAEEPATETAEITNVDAPAEDEMEALGEVRADECTVENAPSEESITGVLVTKEADESTEKVEQPAATDIEAKRLRNQQEAPAAPFRSSAEPKNPPDSPKPTNPVPNAPPSPTLSKSSSHRHRADHWARPSKRPPELKHSSDKPGASEHRTRRYSNDSETRPHNRVRRKSIPARAAAERAVAAEIEHRRWREAEEARQTEAERRRVEDEERRAIRREARKAAAAENARISREEAEAAARRERRRRDSGREPDPVHRSERDGKGGGRPALRRRSHTGGESLARTAPSPRRTSEGRSRGEQTLPSNSPRQQDDGPKNDDAAAPASSDEGKSHRRHRHHHHRHRSGGEREQVWKDEEEEEEVKVPSRRDTERRNRRPVMEKERPQSFWGKLFG